MLVRIAKWRDNESTSEVDGRVDLCRSTAEEYAVGRVHCHFAKASTVEPLAANIRNAVLGTRSGESCRARRLEQDQ
jgi:hypothetical protein